MGERQGALVAAVAASARQPYDEEQSKGFETASTASTTAWSILEAPRLHADDDINHHENNNTQPINTTTALQASHHSCLSDNVSLADSSITTEVGFLSNTNHPTATSSSPTTQEAPASHGSKSNTTITTTSNWKPRSLRDLVRKDLRSSHVDTVERALHQITIDCWDDPKARSAVARAGGILEIVNILEDYGTQQERLATAACQAIEKLALDADNEIAMAAMGGCRLLYQLATTSNSGRVQEAAWAALQNCTCAATAEGDEWDMQQWATQVLPRLQEYPVQLVHAAAASANICVADPQQCHVFGEAGGLVAMATAIRHHWHDTAVRAELAQSMTRICEAVAENQE